MSIRKDDIPFRFWFPLEIEKAKDKDGNKKMRLCGIASTMDKDSDDEFLDPKGFDITPLLESGIVNWHHQSKNAPSAIIGEPGEGTKLTKEGLYVVSELYPDSKLAKEVFELAEVLEKNSKTRRLGYSIEGKVLKRDPLNNKLVKSALITGVAITHQPKNKHTFAEILKGEGIDDYYEEVEKSEVPEVLADVTKEDGSRVLLDSTGKITFIEKALEAGGESTGKPLKREHVSGIKPVVQGKKVEPEDDDEEEENNKEKKKTFSKGEVFDYLFSEYSAINDSKAEKIFNIIQKISTMKKENLISDEAIQKAEELLGLREAVIESEDLEKSEDGEVTFEPFEVNGDTYYSRFVDGVEVKDELFIKSEDDEFIELDDEEIQKAYDGIFEKSDDDEEDIEKSDDPEDDDEEAEEVEKSKDDDEDDDDEEEDDEDDEEDDEEEDEEEDDDEEEPKKPMKKACGVKKSETPSKLTASTKNQNDDLIKAVGTLMKDMRDQIAELKKGIDNVNNTPLPRKSAVTARAVERFEKAENTEGANTVSISRDKVKLLNILDNCTFEKGFDAEFGSAMTAFETSGVIKPATVSRLKLEKNITLVD